MGTNSRANAKANKVGDDYVHRTGVVVVGFDQAVERADDRDVWFQGLSVRPPTALRAEWLVVMRVNTEEQPVVAFHSAGTFAEALKGALERFENGSLVWKDDAYAAGS